MKKYYGIVWAISAALLVIIGISIFNQFVTTSKLNEYILSPESCSMVFAKTPEEFFETDYAYYSKLGDFRNNSEIDKEGNLILRLSDEQINGFLEHCSESIINAKKYHGILISDDYTSFTIVGNKENLPSKMLTVPLTLLRDMAVHQLLTTEKYEEIKITCVVKDESTGIVLYSATCPEEEISLSTDSLDYSKISK